MEKFKDIDKYLKASDIVEMFEKERIRSEENGRNIDGLMDLQKEEWQLL